jgi:hypothetical protein
VVFGFEDGKRNWNVGMKIAGFLLLVAGWIIVLGAVILLASAPRAGFVVAGVAVEVLGLLLVVRSHLLMAEGKN